ncbi:MULTISPECIES: hypothetical protein [Metallosphaera]|uniref:Uncharacterized protein n=3 Tax=Metallosphaera TaxID=41980 RepID=A4YDF9_METS5|nr:MULTISPECIES: hypothetical protein [Metallosphaera]ABP94461.1 hypothetical protein Msed_0284 [Metallosphaera sedula DSM 5348]AIM26448.1 hypothetical protein HA72_0284 [Metallosphaera sedula]AKV73449.1 hypothetical protein MsedA_0295 [Metallosphaera sedula]AKV75692.1 hypothetical protein MsedB_0295 [Metallosphaera sedula]AKV77938.1 hypothetical protein MsedC_0294 [Metallosphaera sedula]
MGFEIIPGLRAVYRVEDQGMMKITGEDINIDLNKLQAFIKENFKIGQDEAKKLDMGDLLGFAMILDNLGIAVMGNYVVFVDAVKTNWNKVLEAFQGVTAQ